MASTAVCHKDPKSFLSERTLPGQSNNVFLNVVWLSVDFLEEGLQDELHSWNNHYEQFSQINYYPNNWKQNRTNNIIYVYWNLYTLNSIRPQWTSVTDVNSVLMSNTYPELGDSSVRSNMKMANVPPTGVLWGFGALPVLLCWAAARHRTPTVSRLEVQVGPKTWPIVGKVRKAIKLLIWDDGP